MLNRRAFTYNKGRVQQTPQSIDAKNTVHVMLASRVPPKAKMVTGRCPGLQFKMASSRAVMAERNQIVPWNYLLFNIGLV